MTAPYRGRFAPSPTGPLHFGSLIAAVASYCDARSQGGEWLVRIEDLDEPRSSRSAAETILKQLDTYGFRSDGPIVWQSERDVLYQAALERLVAAHLAFPCACSRRDLETAATGIGGEPIYPGTCRAGLAPGRAARSWRAAVSDEAIGFRDRVRGWCEQRLAGDVGAFVLKRADGMFAYQLAVVVDDAAQGITHVVRGSDLLASTPRQIWLQRQLGLPTPEYLHHAVAIDAHGEKLSKQTSAPPLPREPLPALLRAWEFLDQPPPHSPPGSAAEFWRWAHSAWNPRLLPPVAMLPAADAAGAVGAAV
jgi:glutamyl-Q tRNA(Asp) synthetase